MNNKEYLGYCTQRGHIYSIPIMDNAYKVVAIKDNNETTLIIHTSHTQRGYNKHDKH